MWTQANRILATLTLVLVVAMIFATGRGPKELITVAILGWFLAFYGEEVAPLLNIQVTSSSADLVAPIIRAIGWLFLFGCCAIAVAYLAGLFA